MPTPNDALPTMKDSEKAWVLFSLTVWSAMSAFQVEAKPPSHTPAMAVATRSGASSVVKAKTRIEGGMPTMPSMNIVLRPHRSEAMPRGMAVSTNTSPLTPISRPTWLASPTSGR